jgi:hypothetical protein
MTAKFYLDGVKDKWIEFREVFSRDTKKIGMITVSILTETVLESGQKVVTQKILTSASNTMKPTMNDFIYKVVDGIIEFEASRDYQVFLTHLKMLLVQYRKFFSK